MHEFIQKSYSILGNVRSRFLLNISINYWILQYLYSTGTGQATKLPEQSVLREVICCSVCSFANQATSSEDRKAVLPGNSNFSSRERAPFSSQNPHGEELSVKGKAGVRKQARDSGGCGGKEHKITLAKVAASECKMCHSYSKNSPSLAAEITCMPTLTQPWDSKGVCECRHNYCKRKDSLTFKQEHQI